MEDREQEHRCRRAAWALAYWGRICACVAVYHFLTQGFRPPPGWWIMFVTEPLAALVREGKRLLGTTILLVFSAVGWMTFLWLLHAGEPVGVGGDKRWLAALGASQLILSGVTAFFTWRAWAHAPKPPPPVRTTAQITRHRQMARLVQVVGLMVGVGMISMAIQAWQNTGDGSHVFITFVYCALLMLGFWALARANLRGHGIAVSASVFLPALIVAPIGAIVGLILVPFGTWKWILAAVYLVATSVALVITMRAIMGGEKKGQGDAG